MTLSLVGHDLLPKELQQIIKANKTANQFLEECKTGAINREKKLFFANVDNYISNLKLEGKYNQYVTKEPRIKRFKEFLKLKRKITSKEDIAFEDITVALLKDFKAYLKGTFKISERTCINYLIIIRTVYNLGIMNRDVSSEYYPFGKDKVAIKFPDTIKIGLT